MHNLELEKDYVKRARVRMKAIKVLRDHESWADVVRECQEVVELLTKALLRHVGIDAPRIHDVSKIMLENKQRMPKEIMAKLEKIAEISKNLRRDREISFYGSEDLTPSEFYEEKDAEKAISDTQFVLEAIGGVVHPLT